MRVGGRGFCGSICVSLHTTFKEENKEKIRGDINNFIVANWQYFKEYYSFEDGHSEKIGVSSKTFINVNEYLAFLLLHPKEASKMWLNHQDLQAASSLYNMNINILTTNLPSDVKPRWTFIKPNKEISVEKKW